jgi:hypothetical protein
MPVKLSGTFEASFLTQEAAIQDAKLLLKLSKDFIIEITGPDGNKINTKALLDASRP